MSSGLAVFLVRIHLLLVPSTNFVKITQSRGRLGLNVRKEILMLSGELERGMQTQEHIPYTLKLLVYFVQLLFC